MPQLKNIFRSLIIVLALGVVIFGIINFSDSDGVQDEPVVRVGDTEVVVEIADTNQEKLKGLSERQSMPDDRGMLFVFEKSGTYSFWMKDMNFPLDIIWINKEGEIVDFVTNISPDTYPQKFSPKKPARFVLEVNAGFIDSNEINRGDIVEVPGSDS